MLWIPSSRKVEKLVILFWAWYLKGTANAHPVDFLRLNILREDGTGGSLAIGSRTKKIVNHRLWISKFIFQNHIHVNKQVMYFWLVTCWYTRKSVWRKQNWERLRPRLHIANCTKTRHFIKDSHLKIMWNRVMKSQNIGNKFFVSHAKPSGYKGWFLNFAFHGK